MNRRLDDLRQKNKYKCEISNGIRWKLYKILAECIGSWKFWIMNRRHDDLRQKNKYKCEIFKSN